MRWLKLMGQSLSSEEETMTKNSNQKLFVAGVIFILLLLSVGSAMAQDEVLLYSQDFESGKPQEWNLEPGWEIVEGDTGHVLAGEGHFWANLTKGSWRDYRFRFKIKLSADAAVHANFRLRDGPIRYFIGLNEGELNLAKQLGEAGFSDTLASAGGLSGGWNTVEITGYGPTITVLVNDQVVMTYTDPEPLLRGGIAFESLTDSQVQIDDVEIWGPAQLPTPTMSSGIQWVRTGGPLGGLGYDVRMHPDNPDVMFVTDAFAGVFKSTDGGETWFPSNNGITTRSGASGDAIPIFSLTLDPNDPNIVWVGTQNVRGIFKSLDGGQTWEEKTNGIHDYEGITFRGFSIDPHSSDIVYAAGELSSWLWARGLGESTGREFDKTMGVVYKTTDGGENWTQIWRGDNLARYIWINPQDSDVLYLSTGIFDREAANSDDETDTPGGVGVLKSTDGGQTWEQINNGITNLYVGTLFMHPENPEVLLAGSSNNAYYDGGGVFLTTNGGASWEKVLNDGVQSVEISTSNPMIAYAGNPGFIYRSADGGRTWQTIQSEEEMGWGPPGVEAGFPIDFQVDPRDPQRIFANNYGGGNFMSEDGGVTWMEASRGYTGAQVRAIDVSPEAPARVFAVARSGIFSSYDGGEHWIGLNNEQAFGLEWNALAIDPDNSQHILAANNWFGGIYESWDEGQSWEHTDIPRVDMQGWRKIAFAPSDAGIVYAASGAFFSAGSFDPNIPASGIAISRDGGSSWEYANDSLTENTHIADLTIHPIDPQVVYAASPKSGLFKTSDGGGNWVRLEGLPEHGRPRSITIHPSQPEILFTGMGLGGLYRSNDSGNSWEPITVGLPPEASIKSIIFNPTDHNQMFLADSFSGVYRSNDGGQTWFAINGGLRTRAVNSLAISSDGLHLFAGTQGEGVFRLDLDGVPPEGSAPPSPSSLQEEPSSSLEEGSPSGEDDEGPSSGFPCPSVLAPLAFIGVVLVWRRKAEV
jgi:photosystem II stability/assembly factor-like uncharacterized protein